MKNSSIESELIGTIKVLDSDQKSDVLSFIKEKLGFDASNSGEVPFVEKNPYQSFLV